MKIIVKILTIIMLMQLFIILLSSVVNATESFVISQYDIHINVNENNTIDVKETLVVDFSESRHGIYRDILKKGILTREINGEIIENNYIYKISNINVKSHKYSTSNEGTYQRIKKLVMLISMLIINKFMKFIIP